MGKLEYIYSESNQEQAVSLNIYFGFLQNVEQLRIIVF